MVDGYYSGVSTGETGFLQEITGKDRIGCLEQSFSKKARYLMKSKLQVRSGTGTLTSYGIAKDQF